ncbi:hypothetical protein SDC9_28939 [bioreactor metagenome]|uniref:Uncharacterized protein n=2 Tax=root TaxID=1 RepID=A0A0S7BYN2_9BACT|nr:MULTISPECIES: DUF5320 domain-containing protein [Lentimicrobium]MEA5110323.1 DUF5320 domain-containing protein [Lentimicrobium sp.]GAP43639.1 hypothetical protein TBC1_111795 [Lentimicrobium saccharophilum]
MPGFDQTGPEGQGPMTGRRMGKCTNYGAGLKNRPVAENESDAENVPGRGPGRGRGMGRGKGRGRGAGNQNRFRGGN